MRLPRGIGASDANLTRDEAVHEIRVLETRSGHEAHASAVSSLHSTLFPTPRGINVEDYPAVAASTTSGCNEIVET